MSMTGARTKARGVGRKAATHEPASNRARVRQERQTVRKAAKAEASEKRGQAVRQAIAAKHAVRSVEVSEGVRRAMLAALIAAGGDTAPVSVVDLALQLPPGGELVWAGEASEWVKLRNAAVAAKRINRRAFKAEEAVPSPSPSLHRAGRPRG